MNKTQRVLLLASMALLASAGLRAQTTTPPAPTTPPASTTPTPPTTPPASTTKTGTTTTTTGKANGKASGKAKGPNENASANAKAVHVIIADFQKQRDEYLAARKVLLAEMGTATEERKKEILALLRADKAAREDEERSLGKQIREELKQLRGERKSGGSS